MAAGSGDVRLKLLIDSKQKRVLFGEADKNLIDFLFNLLSLPLGTVIRLLKKQGMTGCLSNLYESVETLNDTYLQPNQSKDNLLNPKVSFSGSTLLLPNIIESSADQEKLYMCPKRCGYNVTSDPKVICPSRCRYSMTQLCTFVNPPNAITQATNVGELGGFVKDVVTYMVMDDLSVKPMSTISSITLLNKFNIKEVGALEEKIITMDVNQGVKLLRASLESKTVLTDVFLGKTKY